MVDTTTTEAEVVTVVAVITEVVKFFIFMEVTHCPVEAEVVTEVGLITAKHF